MNNADKPAFTDLEIEEMLECREIHFFLFGMSKAMEILKNEYDYSNVNKHIISIRKAINAESQSKWSEFREKYKDSNLTLKLAERIDFNEKVKQLENK